MRYAITAVLITFALCSFAKPKVEMGISFGRLYPYLKKNIGIDVLNKPGLEGTFHLDLNYYTHNPALYFSLGFRNGLATFDVIAQKLAYNIYQHNNVYTNEQGVMNIFYTGITGSLQYRHPVSDGLTIRAGVIAGPTADVDLNNNFLPNKVSIIAGAEAGLMIAERVTFSLFFQHHFQQYEYEVIRKHSGDPYVISNSFGINSLMLDVTFQLGDRDELHQKWWR